MSEQQTIQPRASRWDSLNAGPQSSSRRRPRSSNQGGSNASHVDRNRSQGKQGGVQSLRSEHSELGSWRRRAANDAVGTAPSKPKITEEDEKVRGAMTRLEESITSFLGEKTGETIETSSEEVHSSVRNSTEQLATSLFGVSLPGPSNFLDHTRSQKQNSITPLPNISNPVIWDVAYSLLRHLKLLSQSKERRSNCLELIVSISSLASDCVQSLIHNQKHLQKEQSTRPNSMTDLRLCECASILLDVLGCEGYSPSDGDANTTKELIRKELICEATLFSCLAKILSVSSTRISSKNAKERSGPLFPWGAEKSVNLIVKQTVLPFLESLATGDDAAIPGSMKANCCYGAMECLYYLLKEPSQDASFDDIDQKSTTHTAQLSKHAAAILAPLVIDVLPDGKENQHINPLRSRTLGVIQSFWEWTYELVERDNHTSAEITDQRTNVAMSYQCMYGALNALYVLRKSKGQGKQNTNAHEIDVSTFARQLQSMIQNKELQYCRREFLNLLNLLCLVYPNGSASQWHLFFGQTGAKAPTLLSLMEEGTFVLRNEQFKDKSWITLPSTLHATSSLLSAMPLKLWIAGEGRSSIRMNAGTFPHRIRNALLDVLRCTLSLMTAIREKISHDSLSSEHTTPSIYVVIVQLAGLAGKLCSILPFNGENSVLQKPTTMLVQYAGEIYVQSAKMIVSKTTISNLELRHSMLHKTLSNFANVIIESLASNTVNTIQAFSPASKWLSGASSYDFIGLLLTDACWDHPSSKDRMNMLSSVAKKSPLTLAREPFNLASFCEVCTIQCKSESQVDSRILGLKLVESFVLGRKQSFAECTANSEVFAVVPKTLCPLLFVALNDHSAAVRSCAVSSFGPLLNNDWVDLLLEGTNGTSSTDWAPLECILKLCSFNGEKNANVRASSCKAVGDICTACIGDTLDGAFDDDFVQSFTCKVCKEIANALTDKTASVRSMALFAIGNAALALKARHSATSGHSSSMQHIFPLVCGCVGDKDEKVVANAIRTISHIAYFEYDPHFDYGSSQAISSYKSLLTNLSAKIKFALNDAIGETTCNLTWRQRNGAKKLAWGSCSTLGMLLSYPNMLSCVDDAILFESVLSTLFGCIQFSNAINEKITAAAINALAGLPITLWQHLSGRCDSTGRGLATCFGYLHERKSMSSHHGDIESLANLLLVSAKKADFCTLFLFQESVPFSVEYFYEWIVNQDVEAGVFEEIASAVSSQKVEQVLDVSLVQMFMSRTIRQNRHQGSPCKVNVASLTLGENDYEDDDEL